MLTKKPRSWGMLVAGLIGCVTASAASALAETNKAASGATQVVARVAGKEVTISELRLEMGRLGLGPGDPDAERLALESLVNRNLLAKAARDAELHRKPDAIARMYAAQDQALADLYLAITSQPPEPTRAEIDDFIRDNPTLFANRRAYDFSVLTLETKNFDEDALTPLFDESEDFSRLAALLEKAGAVYAIAGLSQSAAAFPPPIREQLSRYGASDNIVLKGETHTQIMKIMRVRREVAPNADWAPLARRVLLEEAAGSRAEQLVARLKERAEIAYYRASAAPKKPKPESAQQAGTP